MPRTHESTALVFDESGAFRVRVRYKDMNVRFLVDGTWNGINYFTDDTATMRFDLAESFIRQNIAIELE